MKAPIAKLADIAEINPRFRNDGTKEEDEVAFVPMAAVSAETASVEVRETRALSTVLSGFTYFQDGDILVAKITPCFENGKIAQARISQHHGFGSTEFHVVRPDRRKLDDRYLLHLLRQPRIRIEGERKMTGSAGQRRVPKHYLETLDIQLPRLEEQRQIAAILDKTDALRAKRRRALGKADALAQSIFRDLFGDPQTILQKWPTKLLGEILDFLTSGSRGWATYYAEFGDLFLRIQNVRWDELVLADIAYVKAPDTAEARRTRVQPGDVLFSITADLGRTAVVPDGIGTAYINQHLSILRTKALQPRFLSAYFASPGGIRQVAGRNRSAVKAGLNFDDIRSFVIPFPPDELQHEFVNRVTSAERVRALQLSSLSKLDSLFDSLEHRAFHSEI